MCLGEGCAGEEGGLEWGWFRACEVPVEDGAFGAAGDEDRVDGVPGDGWRSEEVSVRVVGLTGDGTYSRLLSYVL